MLVENIDENFYVSWPKILNVKFRIFANILLYQHIYFNNITTGCWLHTLVKKNMLAKNFLYFGEAVGWWRQKNCVYWWKRFCIKNLNLCDLESLWSNHFNVIVWFFFYYFFILMAVLFNENAPAIELWIFENNTHKN